MKQGKPIVTQSHPSEDTIIIASELTPTKSKDNPSESDTPPHPNTESSPSQEGPRTFQRSHIDGQAARRMIENIKSAEIRITELKKECYPRCQCKSCRQNGYTRKVQIIQMQEVLWSGFVIANPNTPSYKAMKIGLNYRQWAGIAIGTDIKKVKYYIDKDLCLPMIKVTHLDLNDTKESRFMANRKEIQALYVQLVLAFLSINCRYWVEPKTQESMEGYVYKRYTINGNWQKAFIKIEKGTIRQGKQAVSIKSPCLWTSFQMMEWQVPHLVIKIWQGFWKAEFGLPINRLPQWLSSFLSLVQIG